MPAVAEGLVAGLEAEGAAVRAAARGDERRHREGPVLAGQRAVERKIVEVPGGGRDGVQVGYGFAERVADHRAARAAEADAFYAGEGGFFLQPAGQLGHHGLALAENAHVHGGAVGQNLLGETDAVRAAHDQRHGRGFPYGVGNGIGRVGRGGHSRDAGRVRAPLQHFPYHVGVAVAHGRSVYDLGLVSQLQQHGGYMAYAQRRHVAVLDLGFGAVALGQQVVGRRYQGYFHAFFLEYRSFRPSRPAAAKMKTYGITGRW